MLGVERQAAGAGGGVDRDQRVARPLGTDRFDHDAGRGLVVGPGEQVGGRIGNRLRGVAWVRLDHDRIGQEGRAGGDLGELRRELAIYEMKRPLPHEAGGGRVPKSGRAAVAQHDLVALGRPEQLGEPAANAPDEGAHGRLTM